MAKQNRTVITLPPGEFIYPWLNVPDSREFNGQQQKPNFNCTVRYAHNNPAWLAKKEVIDAEVEKSYEEAKAANPKASKQITKAYPYRDEVSAEGNETGNVLIKAKQNATITFTKGPRAGTTEDAKIELFDAQGRPVPKAVKIYGGSTGRVSFAVRPYYMASAKSAGISCDLLAVQVINLVTGGGRSAGSYGFDKEEGFSVDDVEAESSVAVADEDVSAESDPTDF